MGKRLMEWGLEKAEKERVDVFLHGTESAQTFYQQVSSIKIFSITSTVC